MVAVQYPHWKDTAIERSEIVSDLWEVSKAWLGRAAEWVLFLCMIASIVQILPGVSLASWFSNTVLGIQAVTLDIAGFGLATMASHAEQCGDTNTARSARRTAWVLIGLMMITVISVSVGTLWPAAKPYTDVADKVLILLRVALTVWYSHVLHDLRGTQVRSLPQPVIEDYLGRLEERLEIMQQTHTQQVQHIHQMVTTLAQRIPEPVNYERLAEQIGAFIPQPETPNSEEMVDQILQQVKGSQATFEREMLLRLNVIQTVVEGFTADVKPDERDQSLMKSELHASRPARIIPLHESPVKDAQAKQTFLHEYLAVHPAASISTIMKAAKEAGISLSTGYISQQRKRLQEEQEGEGA